VALRWVLFTGQVLGFGRVKVYILSSGDSRFVKTLLYSGTKSIGKEALKTSSNIIRDMINKDPEQPVSEIFINCFSEPKDNLVKNDGPGLSLKRKRKSKRLILEVNVER